MKYIIDTDPGIDDAIAISIAVKHKLDIIGFTLAPGNVPQEKSSKNLKLIQEFLGSNIKMYKGDPDKKRNQETAEYAHGFDGLGYYAFPDISNKKFERMKAENFIIKSAKKYKGDLTLICLGSLVNLANALKKYKHLTKKLKHVIIMGAAYNPNEEKQYKDFNIRSNPKAAKLVYETNFEDVRIVTHEIGIYTYIEKDYIKTLKNSHDPLSRFIGLISERYAEFAQIRHNTPGIESPDPVTIASIIDPSIIKFESCDITIVATGEDKGEARVVIKDDGTHKIAVSSDVEKYRKLFKDLFN